MPETETPTSSINPDDPKSLRGVETTPPTTSVNPDDPKSMRGVSAPVPPDKKVS